MAEDRTNNNGNGIRRGKILLVDDEDKFRGGMKRQLEVRGYKVFDCATGDEAIKIVRHDKPEVVVLDKKMPGMDGVQTLKEIKAVRPEAQVIMLTGHGQIEDAVETGKHDAFAFLTKPCGIEELIEAIEQGREARHHAMAHREIPDMKVNSVKQWLVGVHNLRPGLIILGVLLFLLVAYMPTPQSLQKFVTTVKTGETKADAGILGYSDYRKMDEGQNIASYFMEKTGLGKEHKKNGAETSEEEKRAKAEKAVAFRAKVMIGLLVLCAVFWASGALPVGITALLACVVMYLFNVMPPTQIAKAHAKDSVLFIIGVLGLAQAIGKTGLDRRIGLLLLASSKSLKGFLFVFAPLLAVTASFLSEHALVAFIIPVLLLGYTGVVRAAGLAKDRNLLVMLFLVCCFCANIGGPGSPAAGGRNAVMIGILADYNIHISFGEWVKLGLPFVPVCALALATYFYFAFRNKIKVKNPDLIGVIRKETDKIGKMTRNEYVTAVVLVILLVLLITMGEEFGMGGPFLFALVILNVAGILQWRDINGIHWDVVALYASATAMGATMAATGGSLWMADRFVNVLPEVLRSGTGLAVSSSFITGLLTNFMSDGATVAAIGPITVPMGTLSNTSPIMIGLATAFSSSFAHMMIIGTPNNALAYAMARDPETGEQLLTMGDFMKHGTAAVLISWAVLWGWTFFGYWRLMGAF